MPFRLLTVLNDEERVLMRGTTRSVVFAWALLSCLACDRSLFRCAERFGTGDTDITRCDVRQQRCVCSSQLCAAPVALKQCPSGYRYVDSPFGTGACVPTEDLPLRSEDDFADDVDGLCEQPGSGDAGTTEKATKR